MSENQTSETRATAAECERAAQWINDFIDADDGTPSGDFVLDCLYDAAQKIRAHREGKRRRARVRAAAVPVCAYA